MAVPLKQLGSKLSYQEVNDMLKLYPSDTQPSNPFDGQIWLDTSVTPNRLKRYNGSSWDTIGELTAGDLLNLIKTVDGSGSGLDADKIDGIEGSQLARTDTDVEFQGAVRFSVGEGLSIADGGNWTSTPSLGGHGPNDVRLIRIEDGHAAEADGVLIIGGYGPTDPAYGTPTFAEYLYIHYAGFEWKGNKIWHAGNDGSSSGLDADKLDGQEGSFYQDASNLNSGTIPSGRLSASDLLTLVKNVDGTGSGLDADKLDGQEGSFYQNASNLNSGTIPSGRLSASDLLTLVKNVDGTGSGLDADKLDGQEGSFYQDAGNLTTGAIARARLSELADAANPYICANKTNVTQEWQLVYFVTAYTNPPIVVTTVDEAGRIARVTSITTTQFQVQREKANYPDFSFDSGYIYWIAYGNKV